MLIAHSGVNPLHLTPGKLLSDVPATFVILLPCKVVLAASSKRHKLFTAWLVQMLLEGAQLWQDYLQAPQAAKHGSQPWSERSLCKTVVSDVTHIPGLMRLG